MKNYRQAAFALLRVTLGSIFLTTGVVKFVFGVGNFAAGLQQQFADKLPMFIVTPFAYALPIAEVIVGLLLVVGLFTEMALVLSGVLLLILTFGRVVTNDSATVAHNLSYAFINFMLLWLAEYNGYSIDRYRRTNRPSIVFAPLDTK